jgi:methylphosphotriester-DNA--protein-cysteine methyltransferase
MSFEEWYTQGVPSQPTKSEARPVARPRPTEAPRSTVAAFVAEGDKFLEQQKLEAAITSYRKAIEAEPNSATLLFKKGIACSNKYYNQGKNIADLRASVMDYSRAIELNPQFGEAVFQRAGFGRSGECRTKLRQTMAAASSLMCIPLTPIFVEGFYGKS